MAKLLVVLMLIAVLSCTIAQGQQGGQTVQAPQPPQISQQQYGYNPRGFRQQQLPFNPFIFALGGNDWMRRILMYQMMGPLGFFINN